MALPSNVGKGTVTVALMDGADNAAKTATTYTVTGRSPGPYTVAVRPMPA